MATAVSVSERALRYDIDDFFLVKGSLRRRSLSASFSVPPYMATCVAISMSVLSSVFINCNGTRLLSHFFPRDTGLPSFVCCTVLLVCCLTIPRRDGAKDYRKIVKNWQGGEGRVSDHCKRVGRGEIWC